MVLVKYFFFFIFFDACREYILIAMKIRRLIKLTFNDRELTHIFVEIAENFSYDKSQLVQYIIMKTISLIFIHIYNLVHVYFTSVLHYKLLLKYSLKNAYPSISVVISFIK